MESEEFPVLVNPPKRSKSCVEPIRNRFNITSERLSELRKCVENAVKEHKTFTVRGGWNIIRRELRKRNWVEKYETPIPSNKPKSSIIPSSNSVEDLTGDLPQKQEWESSTVYMEKCERTIMSRMLKNQDVDFYWSLRKDQADILHRSNCSKIMSRFCRALYASKEGLALLLQQNSRWFVEPGVSQVNFPRCYVLGFPEHFNHFVDDFRLTASISLLKWLVSREDRKLPTHSSEGTVPANAINFAIERITEFIEIQKHIDLDKDINRIWDHEWDQFLSCFYSVVHENNLFIGNNAGSYVIKAKLVLHDLTKYWPEYNNDGIKNIWIVKPGNKCRGRGIQLVKKVEDVEKLMGLKMKYVVQKYIEKPLLIHNTKFDIRQWFLIASSQPLTIWMYRENYLRFSTQIFSLDNFHESFHLTNYAVQCKYANTEQRDKDLPHDNMWDCHTFKTYLRQMGCAEKWDDVIYPGLKQGIICAMLSCQEVMDRRQNTFELYGADFMIGEDFKPWLLEINCSPDLSASTSVTSKMCPQCLEDVIKVIIDKRHNSNADTGLFECIYRQNLPTVPSYLGTNLLVRGRRLLKNRLRFMQTSPVPMRETNEEKKYYQQQADAFKKRASTKGTDIIKSVNLKSCEGYKGPIIEDFLGNLQVQIHEVKEDCGVNFVPMLATDKKLSVRVSRKDCKNKNIKQNFCCRIQRTVSKENFAKNELGQKKEEGRGDETVWRKGTNSISNKDNASNAAPCKADTNKNSIKFPCLTLDLNNLLSPQS